MRPCRTFGIVLGNKAWCVHTTPSPSLIAIEARLAVDDRGLNNTNQTTATLGRPPKLRRAVLGRPLANHRGAALCCSEAGQAKAPLLHRPNTAASKSHAATGLCRSPGLAILRTLPITGTAGPRARRNYRHLYCCRRRRRRCCGKGTAPFQGSTPADRLHAGHPTTCDCTEVWPRLASCLHESKTWSVLLTTACDTTAQAATSPAVSAKLAIYIP